jgi:cation:H+ antiporter
MLGSAGKSGRQIPAYLMLYLLIAAFVSSLLVAIGASVFFTRRLEVISDIFGFSPGLLSWLGALGANIPNYVSSLDAMISGQAGVGLGIIIGSNIYNIAVILGLSALVAPGRRGIALSLSEARDARPVGGFALAIMVTTGLAAAIFSWKVSPSLPQRLTLPVSIALLIFNLLSLGLFAALSAHVLRRLRPTDENSTKSIDGVSSPLKWRAGRALAEMIIALGIALGAVVVMVQAGETAASDIHLPQAILSLVILAVATSLPNTTVALTLARTGRASASVEEVFSSNSVNAALGIALPLLFWSGLQSDPFLIFLDAPLMVALTCIALLCVSHRRLVRPVGLLLLLVYISWVMIHLLL